jgi:hypothetical protein
MDENIRNITGVFDDCQDIVKPSNDLERSANYRSAQPALHHGAGGYSCCRVSASDRVEQQQLHGAIALRGAGTRAHDEFD